MDDLSHWDFAEQFSGQEAACLILGISPEEHDRTGSTGRVQNGGSQKITPVLRRMQTSFLAAQNSLDAAITWGEGGFETFPIRPGELQSAALTRYLEVRRYENDVDPTRESFEYAYFSRLELHRWLEAISCKSLYCFDHSAAEFNSTNSLPAKAGRWPWGVHHTSMLGHLEAAARRFWVDYDPTDQTTAVTNAHIIDWLSTERKVSKKMAEAIATMLRVDGLPTGPRK